MKRRILFYCDAREFGGHEYMTTSAVRFMAEQQGLDVSFAYNDRNQRLHDELSSIRERGNITLYPLRLKSEGLRWVRPLFYFSRLLSVQRLMQAVEPDAIVVSQGNIEISSLGLLAAKRSRRRTISYIPMAQELGTSSGLLSVARRAVNAYLYNLPDRFITISEGIKQMLRQRGVRCEILVVRNGIELESNENGNRSSHRSAYGFSADDYVVAVVGRIVFGQKAQDFLVNTVARYKDYLQGILFCVVGEGRDEQKLRNMIRHANLEDRFSILPWTRNLSSLYSAADMLLIPSRFEGVPLVMLEAMWHQVPVVASNVDGMAEILPREWLFRCGDACSLVDTISRVRSADSLQLLQANKKRVSEEFSMSQFQKRFCAEITEAAEPVGMWNEREMCDSL